MKHPHYTHSPDLGFLLPSEAQVDLIMPRPVGEGRGTARAMGAFERVYSYERECVTACVCMRECVTMCVYV